MPRPLLPPDAWGRVSTKVLFEKGLSPVVRDTYVMLRMLAWSGNETPELSWEQIATHTGKPRATVYRHLLMLATTGVIHWRPTNTRTIIVTFIDGIGEQSQNWDSLSQKRDSEPPADRLQNLPNAGETSPKALSQKRDKPPLLVKQTQEQKPKRERSLKNEIVSQKRDSAPPADLHPLVAALAEVCRMNLEANRGRLFAEAKLLSKAKPEPTPDLVRQHYNSDPGSFWRKADWRGKQGEKPTPATIRQTWGQWSEAESAAFKAQTVYE